MSSNASQTIDFDNPNNFLRFAHRARFNKLCRSEGRENQFTMRDMVDTAVQMFNRSRKSKLIQTFRKKEDVLAAIKLDRTLTCHAMDMPYVSVDEEKKTGNERINRVNGRMFFVATEEVLDAFRLENPGINFFYEVIGLPGDHVYPYFDCDEDAPKRSHANLFRAVKANLTEIFAGMGIALEAKHFCVSFSRQAFTFDEDGEQTGLVNGPPTAVDDKGVPMRNSMHLQIRHPDLAGPPLDVMHLIRSLADEFDCGCNIDMAPYGIREPWRLFRFDGQQKLKITTTGRIVMVHNELTPVSVDGSFVELEDRGLRNVIHPPPGEEHAPKVWPEAIQARIDAFRKKHSIGVRVAGGAKGERAEVVTSTKRIGDASGSADALVATLSPDYMTAAAAKEAMRRIAACPHTNTRVFRTTVDGGDEGRGITIWMSKGPYCPILDGAHKSNNFTIHLEPFGSVEGAPLTAANAWTLKYCCLDEECRRRLSELGKEVAEDMKKPAHSRRNVSVPPLYITANGDLTTERNASIIPRDFVSTGNVRVNKSGEIDLASFDEAMAQSQCRVDISKVIAAHHEREERAKLAAAELRRKRLREARAAREAEAGAGKATAATTESHEDEDDDLEDEEEAAARAAGASISSLLAGTGKKKVVTAKAVAEKAVAPKKTIAKKDAAPKRAATPPPAPEPEPEPEADSPVRPTKRPRRRVISSDDEAEEATDTPANASSADVPMEDAHEEPEEAEEAASDTRFPDSPPTERKKRVIAALSDEEEEVDLGDEEEVSSDDGDEDDDEDDAPQSRFDRMPTQTPASRFLEDQKRISKIEESEKQGKKKGGKRRGGDSDEEDGISIAESDDEADSDDERANEDDRAFVNNGDISQKKIGRRTVPFFTVFVTDAPRSDEFQRLPVIAAFLDAMCKHNQIDTADAPVIPAIIDLLSVAQVASVHDDMAPPPIALERSAKTQCMRSIRNVFKCLKELMSPQFTKELVYVDCAEEEEAGEDASAGRKQKRQCLDTLNRTVLDTIKFLNNAPFVQALESLLFDTEEDCDLLRTARRYISKLSKEVSAIKKGEFAPLSALSFRVMSTLVEISGVDPILCPAQQENFSVLTAEESAKWLENERRKVRNQVAKRALAAQREREARRKEEMRAKQEERDLEREQRQDEERRLQEELEAKQRAESSNFSAAVAQKAKAAKAKAEEKLAREKNAAKANGSTIANFFRRAPGAGGAGGGSK